MMQMMEMNPPDDWLKTGRARDSQTRTRLVDSLFRITCSLENNAFSYLHYVIKVTLHNYMLQLNLSNTDTEGTERSVRIREVSV